MDLSLSARHEGDYTIIECGGELDIATVSRQPSVSRRLSCW